MTDQEFVKKEIIRLFQVNGAHPGRPLSLASFLQYVMNWTPNQRACIEPVMDLLLREGLVKMEGGCFSFTGHPHRKK